MIATYPADSRIGLLSDSHGRVDITRRAVNLLMAHGANVILHLGDFERLEVMDVLAESSNGPTHIVFGNVDFDVAELTRYAISRGLLVNHPAGCIRVGECSVVFTHGHMPSYERDALAEAVPFFCHGHSHEVRNEKISQTRIINPGALHRAVRYNVAVLEPEIDCVTHLEVPRE